MKGQCNQIKFIQGCPSLAGRMLRDDDILLAQIGECWRRVTIGLAKYKHYDLWCLRDETSGEVVSGVVETPARLVGKNPGRKAVTDD